MALFKVLFTTFLVILVLVEMVLADDKDSKHKPSSASITTHSPATAIKEDVESFWKKCNTTIDDANKIANDKVYAIIDQITKLSSSINSNTQGDLQVTQKSLDSEIQNINQTAVALKVDIQGCYGDIQYMISSLPDTGVKNVNNCVQKQKNRLEKKIKDDLDGYIQFTEEQKVNFTETIEMCRATTDDAEVILCYENLKLRLVRADQTLVPLAKKKANRADNTYDELASESKKCMFSETMSLTNAVNKQVAEVLQCAYEKFFTVSSSAPKNGSQFF